MLSLATLFQVTGGLLAVHEVGLSETVWRTLGVKDSDEVKVNHP